MVKKILAYLLIVIGVLCFLLVGGGSMRYRNRKVIYSNSINESLIHIGILVVTPIIGYFLLKYGFKLLKNK